MEVKEIIAQHEEKMDKTIEALKRELRYWIEIESMDRFILQDFYMLTEKKQTSILLRLKILLIKTG